MSVLENPWDDLWFYSSPVFVNWFYSNPGFVNVR